MVGDQNIKDKAVNVYGLVWFANVWCKSCCQLYMVYTYIYIYIYMYIPVGISRVTLGRQFVDYNPPALGWVYYTLGCLRFFLFTTNCKTIDKLSLLQVALYLH